MHLFVASDVKFDMPPPPPKKIKQKRLQNQINKR